MTRPRGLTRRQMRRYNYALDAETFGFTVMPRHRSVWAVLPSNLFRKTGLGHTGLDPGPRRFGPSNECRNLASSIRVLGVPQSTMIVSVTLPSDIVTFNSNRVARKLVWGGTGAYHPAHSQIAIPLIISIARLIPWLFNPYFLPRL